jgi:hypothetical protein
MQTLWIQMQKLRATHYSYSTIGGKTGELNSVAQQKSANLRFSPRHPNQFRILES